jgi:uncharacterized protein
VRLCVLLASSSLALLAATSSAHAASFDCTTAKTFVEHAICDNPDLSAKDDVLAPLYRSLRRNDGTGAVVKAQREWVARRNTCQTVVCVSGLYDQRLTELRAVATHNQSIMKDLAGLADRLEQDSYRASFAKLIEGEANVGPWLKDVAKGNGDLSGAEGRVMSVGGNELEYYEACQAHLCSVTEIHVLFSPGGKRAWALFLNDDKRRFLGYPDEATKAALLATFSQ